MFECIKVQRTMCFGWHCRYAAENMFNTVPGMLDELRRPMMLLVSARKRH